MGNGGCPTALNVLAYKLRASDSAVINTYPAISKHHKDVNSRHAPQAAMYQGHTVMHL